MLRLIHEMPVIHTAVGLCGNALFFIGSILFFQVFEDWRTLAVWLFVVGSFLMLLGSLGEVLRKYVQHREGQLHL